MKELRPLVEKLGHGDVRTYLQSGNVVFTSGSRTPRKLAGELEVAISQTFKLDVAVIIRSVRELERVVEENPFPTEGTNPSYLHVMFLADKPASSAAKKLDSNRSKPDEFQVKGRDIYMWFPTGSGRTKLTVGYFEKMLGTRATARNWNTVLKVLELIR